MKKKVLILKPRLDLPFKRFGLEIKKDSIEPIRVHWQNFVDKLHEYHVMKHDKVVVVEEQRWKFNWTMAEQFYADIVYVPHTEKHLFKGDKTCRYYMQTVFPWLFTVDSEGWGGGATFSKEGYEVEPDEGRTFNLFKARAERGESKFHQNSGEFINKLGDFIFVPLQLPHDETIKWHSKQNVLKWAESIAKWGSRNSVPIVFKNHPINPNSLSDTKEVVRSHSNVVWIDHEVNIHSVMRQAKAVYIINSGTGAEAMLHDVPVVRFGLAEYNQAVIEGDIMDLDRTWQKVRNLPEETMKDRYRTFYNWFVNRICYDSTNIGSFLKLR